MDQNLSALLACLTCLIPFVIGWAAGVWFNHRAARHGTLGALLPDFIRHILEKYQ